MTLKHTKYIRSAYLLFCFCLSILTIIALFIFSEHVNHRPNGFIRLLPPHPISALYSTNLTFNSYYIAGVSESRIYLANYTTPGVIYSYNHQLKDTHRLVFSFPPNTKFHRASATLSIDSPFVYLSAYRNSVLLSGQLPAFELHNLNDSMNFYECVPISKNSYIFQVFNTNGTQNLVVKKSFAPSTSDTSSVLDKKREGAIATDGKFLLDKITRKLFYVYYYRNQFISLDTNFRVYYNGRTIDTISKPHIKIAEINDDRVMTMAAPPLRVNKGACLNGQWLMIHSGLLANNEEKNTFDSSAVIDVYAEKDGKYSFSFYISDNDNEKIKGFEAFKKELIVLYDHSLFVYRLNF